MNATIISIGDELLIGQTVNTNAAWMGEQLLNIGVHARWVTTVGDRHADLLHALSIASSRADVILMTGGLGPTHDDVTKKAACEFFGASLTLNKKVLAQVKARFRKRGIAMAPVNEEQALVPDNAEIMQNELGTAPGMVFKRDNITCYIMPGVPGEMKGMMTRVVLPQLRKRLGGRTILIKTLMTTGVPESSLFERLNNLDEIEKQARIAFLPSLFGVKIRLLAVSTSRPDAEKRLAAAELMVRKKIADAIYAEEDISLVKAVADLLLERKKTLAVAESCTGGLVANLLTNIPGSSGFFNRGVIAYSNDAKKELLQVPGQTLEEYGAVSAETAHAMAEGVRKISATDFGIAVTGIAGPGGGTAAKPVGLVYVACSDALETITERHLFANDRQGNKQRSAQAILNLLRKQIIKDDV